MTRSTFALTALTLLAGPVTANALTVIDATNFCAGVSSCANGSIAVDNYPTLNFEVAQTFTVVNTGTLTEVDLFGAGGVGGSALGVGLNVYIVPVVSGVPVTDLSLALGATSKSVSGGSPGLLSLSGLSVAVASGETLAMVVTADPADYMGVGVNYTSSSTYAGGSMFYGHDETSSAPPTAWDSVAPADLYFTTYVDCSTSSCVAASLLGPPQAPPASVPEPATLSLLTLSLAGVGFMRRRKAS